MGPLRASRLLLLALLAMPALRAVAADPASWPGTDWETSTPAREALDPDALAALDADLRAGRFGYVDSMLVARHGRIVAEGNYPRDYRAINAPLVTATPGQWNYYDADWHPWYRDTGLHTLQSTTKSVGSALAGIAIAQGAIRSTDAPLGELLPHRDIRDPRKAAITLDNVLTMRSGFAWNEDELSYRDPLNDSIVVESTRDWVGYLLAKPLTSEQGSTYSYNSTNTQMIGEIVATAVGKPLEMFAEEALFGPIGIRDYHWKRSPEGFSDTGGGFYLRPRDLARFALLYLRGGEWNGRQVIPAQWVARTTETRVVDTAPADPSNDTGYGYQWWIFEHGGDGKPRMVGTSGWGGQFALLVPDLDLIAVFTGWNTYDNQNDIDVVRAFYQRVVLPAAKK